MPSAPTDQARLTTQFSNRTGSIVRMIWHHQAGTNDDATINAMVSGSRQVSATWTVNNDNPGGRGWSRITQVVPDGDRPWTSSSQTADGRALTAEVCNSSGDPDWGIADATHEACARLAAYAFNTYGVPLRRATASNPTGHLGHKEVLGIFGEGYATACPMNLDIDRIIARAQQLVGAGESTQGSGQLIPDVQEDDMANFTDEQREDLLYAAGLIKQLEEFGPNALSNFIKNGRNEQERINHEFDNWWPSQFAVLAEIRSAVKGESIDYDQLSKALAPAVVGPILAAIKANGGSSDEATIETALRNVLGSLDGKAA